MEEIGTCAAILAGISTKVDGSIKITFEVNPESQEIIAKLMRRFSRQDNLYQIGIVGVDQ